MTYHKEPEVPQTKMNTSKQRIIRNSLKSIERNKCYLNSKKLHADSAQVLELTKKVMLGVGVADRLGSKM